MNPADILILIAASLGGLIAARWAGAQAGDSVGLRRAVALLAGVGVAFTVFETATIWLTQTHDPWNAARLTPAVALHYGFNLYYPLHEGPVLSTVVGPVAFLAYWPIGFLPASPTILILAGSALNLLAVAGLGVALVRRLAPRSATALLAWIVGAQLVIFYPSLRYSIFCIHADAPALILGSIGIGLVVFAAGPLTWSRAALSALCLALAVWAKQSFAPVFVIAALLALWRGGWRDGIRLAVASLAVGLAVSGVFIGTIGFSVLRDNMVVVPSRHPWLQMSLSTGEIFHNLTASSAGARLKVLAAASLQIVRENWPIFALLTAASLERLARRERGALLPAMTPWMAFFLVALGLFPTAALGRVKLGGEVNHESFVIFFLVAAIICWLADQTGDPPARQLRLMVVLCALVLVNAPRGLEYSGWRAAWDNQNENACRFDRAHPGEVYFPWNPLTSLLAEGRLYHFDYGVYDRNLGKAPVAAGHIAQNLPAPRPLIASYLAHHDYILRTYFPDYRERPALRDLPDWRIYGPPQLKGAP